MKTNFGHAKLKAYQSSALFAQWRPSMLDGLFSCLFEETDVPVKAEESSR